MNHSNMNGHRAFGVLACFACVFGTSSMESVLLQHVDISMLGQISVKRDWPKKLQPF